jgi:exopolysaccharide production protein ExoZ
MIPATAGQQPASAGQTTNALKAFLASELQAGAAGRLLAMDGLRGLAVTLVFFVHFDSLFAKLLPSTSALVRVSGALGSFGHVGVDLFFVLSGFLIYGGLIRARPKLGKYFARRARRVYPTFLAVFLVYLGLTFVFPGESKLPQGHAVWYVLANLALLPGVFAIVPLITVAWSLSYEVFFYLTIPALIDLLRLRSVSRGARVAIVLALAAAITAFGEWTGDPRVRTIMFAIGIVAYEALEAKSFRSLVERSRGEFLVALLAVTVVFFEARPEVIGVGRLLIFAPALFFVAVFALGAPRGATRALSGAPLCWLGRISYSYYLIHGLALKALAMLAGRLLHGHTSPLGMCILLVASFGFTLVAAQILYSLVEYPLSVSGPSPRPAPAAVPPGPGWTSDRAA